MIQKCASQKKHLNNLTKKANLALSLFKGAFGLDLRRKKAETFYSIFVKSKFSVGSKMKNKRIFHP